jgi:hypothetical protein
MKMPCRKAVGLFYLYENGRGNRSKASSDSMSEKRALMNG